MNNCIYTEFQDPSYYEYDDANNNNNSGYMKYLLTIGLGVLGWKIYNEPIFRRDFIQCCFKVGDYIYDKYHNLRYDDKIRRKSLLKEQPPCLTMDDDFSQLKQSHKLTLLEFFSNELKFESLSLKEKQYYIIGTKSENVLLSDKILEFPWLAASLEIILLTGETHTFEITNKFKNFWLEHNQLPLHVEYYDVWISELLLDCKPIISKQEIKELKLTVIDQLGDFIEYSDVLIEPSKDETRIINFPTLNTFLTLPVIPSPKSSPSHSVSSSSSVTPNSSPSSSRSSSPHPLTSSISSIFSQSSFSPIVSSTQTTSESQSESQSQSLSEEDTTID
jgi:hypothetical protein